MSATLYFWNHNAKELVRPWACQCVKRLSLDAYEAACGLMEECGCEDKDCNMGNANCRSFLAAIGFSTDFENDAQMIPQELYAACDRFINSDLWMLEGVGRAHKEEIGARGCRVISFGVDGNYLVNRAVQIKSLCEAAMLAGATRCYFA